MLERDNLILRISNPPEACIKMTTESFPALDAIPRIRSGFTRRVAGLDVCVERELALKRLQAAHREALADAGLQSLTFATADQVHGHHVARVSASSVFPVPDTDGLLTTVPGVCLGIYVADCAAVFLADRKARGIALVHSGKKGTEQNISSAAIEALCAASGASPSDLVAQISPCIRPPHYEIPFAAQIVLQLQVAGVGEIHDSGTCTASHPADYYSYRREKGLTGRMLAFLAIQ
jgi:copper oxidase (laccase) domain-containing protein